MVRNLQSEFSGRSEDQGLELAFLGRVPRLREYAVQKG